MAGDSEEIALSNFSLVASYRDRHLFAQAEARDARRQANRRIRRRSKFFHHETNRLVAALVRPQARLIDVGCGDMSLVSACDPSIAVGIDVDPQNDGDSTSQDRPWTTLVMPVEHVSEVPLEVPDYVILSMVLDEVYDTQEVLESVYSWCAPETRVIVVTYSRLWRPLLRLAEFLHLKVRVPNERYLPRQQVENMLELSGFEITKRQEGVLLPIWIPVLSRFMNRWLAPLPLVRALCLVQVTVARPLGLAPREIDRVSVIVPARNEAGHIREMMSRIPRLATQQEVIFVEGGSSDDTWERIQDEVKRSESSPRPGETVIALKQKGAGKGDAVRTGFAAATGDVLVILDADISVPPEQLRRFVEALTESRCELANGSRLVYPMEAKAMRLLNMVANRFFGTLFSYLLGQPVGDTLCGTKALRRETYDTIAANRSRLGELDPFGDFDLLFGASALSLRIRDVPVHYKERTYGETNISRFRHGVLLVRMAARAALRIKFVG